MDCVPHRIHLKWKCKKYKSIIELERSVEIRWVGLRGVTINDNSKVIAADIAATNGVVHMIDTVLLPPSGPSKNIVELALDTDVLSTLVTLGGL